MLQRVGVILGHRRIGMSLGVMIRTLGQARRVCDRGKWDKLFVKVQERVKRRLGIYSLRDKTP